MKQAEPQLNYTTIALIIIALGVAFGLGYCVRVDHDQTVQNLRTRKLVLPKPTGVIDEKFIKQTVYRYSRSICKQRKEAGL